MRALHLGPRTDVQFQGWMLEEAELQLICCQRKCFLSQTLGPSEIVLSMGADAKEEERKPPVDKGARAAQHQFQPVL